MPRTAWGFSIFADDLRPEIANKYSLMGIYQADLLVQGDFPITLAKLAMLTHYYEEKGAHSADLAFRVRGGGQSEPLFSVDIPRSGLQIPPYPYEVPESERDPLFHAMIPVVFSPFVINEPGFVRVTMQCGDVITPLGRLMIRKATADEAAQFANYPNASAPPSSQSPSAS